jgi:hypothetical protein
LPTAATGKLKKERSRARMSKQAQERLAHLSKHYERLGPLTRCPAIDPEANTARLLGFSKGF